MTLPLMMPQRQGLYSPFRLKESVFFFLYFVESNRIKHLLSLLTLALSERSFITSYNAFQWGVNHSQELIQATVTHALISTNTHFQQGVKIRFLQFFSAEGKDHSRYKHLSADFLKTILISNP